MIYFVMGPACAGKSTFIKNNFKNIKVIDLWEYQKDVDIIDIDSIWDTYVKCKDDLISFIKENNEVVLEHTLLKAERRKYYIDEIRKITKEPIIIYVIYPNIEEYKIRCLKRNIKFNLCYLDVYEEPTLKEGFEKIIIIKD